MFGVGVYGVDIDLTLEGPTPWHAHGTASLSFFFFSVDIGIDFTWGDSRTPAAAGRGHADPHRRAGKRSNWRALLPRARTCSSRCGNSITAETAFVLHPVGTLRGQPAGRAARPDARQGRQPDAERRQPVRADRVFHALAKTRDLQEPFAPAQFKNLDDATKLSQPAYAPQDSGIELSATGNAYASGTAITRIVRYDLTIIDTKLRRVFRRFFTFNGVLFGHFLAGSAWRGRRSRRLRRRRNNR